MKQLNIDIRMSLQESGKLPVTVRRAGNADTVEHVYNTNDGIRSFIKGDRLVFLENNRDLGVKNGMLGTVERTGQGRLAVRLDGGKGHVEIDASKYKAFDHGYATTIHKTQGATVDRSFLLASNTMDRHLTYVGMTRHRERGQLYGAVSEFRSMNDLTAKLGGSGSKASTLNFDRTFGRSRGFDLESKRPDPSWKPYRNQNEKRWMGRDDGSDIER